MKPLAFVFDCGEKAWNRIFAAWPPPALPAADGFIRNALRTKKEHPIGVLFLLCTLFNFLGILVHSINYSYNFIIKILRIIYAGKYSV